MNDVDRLGTEHRRAVHDAAASSRRRSRRSHAGPACFVRQWLRFARGVRETLAERCGRLWLQDKFDAAGGDIRELMVQSVLDPDFVERRP